MSDTLHQALAIRNEQLRHELELRWDPVRCEGPTEGRYPIRNDKPPSTLSELDEHVFPWAVECCTFNQRGEVLLIKHRFYENDWQFPGGSGNPDEPPEYGARREL